MSTFRVDPKRDHMTAEEWTAKNIPYICGNCEAMLVPVDADNRQGSWCHEFKAEICDDGDEQECPCFFVEFGLMYDDYTWNTEVIEVPMVYTHDRCEDHHLIDWANAVLTPQTKYRNVVQFTIYHRQRC